MERSGFSFDEEKSEVNPLQFSTGSDFSMASELILPAGVDYVEFPIEILEIIFSFLPFYKNSWFNANLVSRNWNIAANRVLTSQNNDPNFRLFNSIQSGSYCKILKNLGEKGVDPSLSNNAVLIYASSNGYSEMTRKILNHPSSDPNARNSEALKLAAKNGHLKTVLVLIHDKRTKGHLEAFHLAWKNKHVDIVEAFIKSRRVKQRELPRKIRWQMSFFKFVHNFSSYPGESTSIDLLDFL